MERSRWKTIFLFLLVVLSTVYLVPSVANTDELPSWFTSLGFTRKVQLGLDLQGGLYIVYGVDLNKAVLDEADERKRDLDDALEEAKIDATVATLSEPPGAINIVLKKAADKGKIDDKFMDDYSDVLVSRSCSDENTATTVCLRVSSDYADSVRDAALKQNIIVMKERINRFGVSEPTVIRKGDSIVVELPGLNDSDTDDVEALLNKAAQLEFKIVDDNSKLMQRLAAKVAIDPKAKELGISFTPETWTAEESEQGTFSDVYLTADNRNVNLTIEEVKKQKCEILKGAVAVAGKIECKLKGDQVLRMYIAGLQDDELYQIAADHQMGYNELAPVTVQTAKKTASWRTFYMHRATELTGSAVKDARVVFDPTSNRPEVLITFNRYGTRRFGDLTSGNVGRKMAIILDQTINSAPIIQGAITGGRSNISMGGSDIQVIKNEAEMLVNVLQTGALSAPLEKLSKTRVGPMLGQDSIDRAKTAMLIGAIMVVLIMLYFYRVAGIIAIFALGLNVLFELSLLAALQAALTLPGIAALVLTVGMAVDANIIIFERIREELRSGKSVRGSVDAGFAAAFWTVFDAQVTTFVAGFVLYEYGTGPIRGFAAMLLIGVICNLFTSTWVSRLFFHHYVGRRRTAATTISI